MFFQWFLFCYIVADNDCIICIHLQYSTNCLSPHPVSNKCFQRRGFFVIETRKVCVNGRSLILVEMDRCYLKYFSVKFFVAFIQLYLTEIKQLHLLTNVNYCSCSSQSLYYNNNNFSRNISLSLIKMKGNFFFCTKNHQKYFSQGFNQLDLSPFLSLYIVSFCDLYVSITSGSWGSLKRKKKKN